MYFKGCALIVLTAIMIGCAKPSLSPSYYRLSATQSVEQTYKLPADSFGIGPVKLSAYLSRRGIVTHKGLNELSYSTNNRWAEPLLDNIVQVLQDNFILLLPDMNLSSFPWRRSLQPDYQLRISIKKFGSINNREVVLHANWQINDRNEKLLITGNNKFYKELDDTDYQSIVLSQSDLLSQLSTEIINALAGQSAY